MAVRLDDKTRRQFAEAGARGGAIRAANLTAKRRKAIARKAAEARWSKKHASQKKAP